MNIFFTGFKNVVCLLSFFSLIEWAKNNHAIEGRIPLDVVDYDGKPGDWLPGTYTTQTHKT